MNPNKIYKLVCNFLQRKKKVECKKYYWVLPVPDNKLDNEDYCQTIQKIFHNSYITKHCRLDRLKLEIFESTRLLIALPNTIYGITYDELQKLKQKNEQYR